MVPQCPCSWPSQYSPNKSFRKLEQGMLRASITVPLTSCLTGLDQSSLKIKTKIVSCHTTDASQTGGQQYSDTSPFSIPWVEHQSSFSQLVILAKNAFGSSTLSKLVILAPSYSINWSFCQLVILSTGHFVNWSFCQLVILSIGHFVNRLFFKLSIMFIVGHFANAYFVNCLSWLRSFSLSYIFSPG